MIDRTLTSRYECKYLLTPAEVDRFRAAIRPFMRPDEYASRCPGNRYEISSLYLDTPDRFLYRQGLEGVKNRIKLRVRTYGDGADDPVFFEVKRRMDGIVGKSRARLPRERALKVLAQLVGRRTGAELLDIERVGEFALHTRCLAVVPVVRVRYEREAYESSGVDPVRVTFDTALSYAMTREPELSHVGGRWESPHLGGVVLEIKFTELFPSWVSELVQRFQLERCSVSKYNRSLDDAGAARRELPSLLRGGV